MSKRSTRKSGEMKRHLSPASELRRMSFRALSSFSPVKVMGQCNTILKGNLLLPSDLSFLLVLKPQAESVSPAKVHALIAFNKIVQQLGIVSQLPWLLGVYCHNVWSDEIRLTVKTCAADVI